MQTAVASSRHKDSYAAGGDLAVQIGARFDGAPHAIVVFAAPSHDHARLLNALADLWPDCLIVGASSAGEFMNHERGVGLACALGLRGDDVSFSVGIGKNVKSDAKSAASELSSGFRGLKDYAHPHRAALVMMDALAGHADLLVDELTLATAGQYQFFGGGAGDNAQFQRTAVFCGREVLNGAAVALEILSDKPLAIGVRHGWQPASQAYRVTEVDDMRLVSLNGLPAVEAFQAHAEQTRQTLDRSAPIPFFLHNILGVDTGVGHQLRVPLAVLDDGSVICAAEVPLGAVVHIMRSSHGSAIAAVENATDAALAALGPHKAQAAVFFDCVATRLRMGESFGEEITTVRNRLSGVDLMGCNTHGQIARAEGQYEGFHNCTAVVCLFPE